MSSEVEPHEYRVTETVEHTIVADRPLTGPEIKRAVDRSRSGGEAEPGVEIRWSTASQWGGLVLDPPADDHRPHVPTRMVDAVDDSFD